MKWETAGSNSNKRNRSHSKFKSYVFIWSCCGFILTKEVVTFISLRQVVQRTWWRDEYFHIFVVMKHWSLMTIDPCRRAMTGKTNHFSWYERSSVMYPVCAYCFIFWRKQDNHLKDCAIPVPCVCYTNSNFSVRLCGRSTCTELWVPVATNSPLRKLASCRILYTTQPFIWFYFRDENLGMECRPALYRQVSHLVTVPILLHSLYTHI